MTVTFAEVPEKCEGDEGDDGLERTNSESVTFGRFKDVQLTRAPFLATAKWPARVISDSRGFGQPLGRESLRFQPQAGPGGRVFSWKARNAWRGAWILLNCLFFQGLRWSRSDLRLRAALVVMYAGRIVEIPSGYGHDHPQLPGRQFSLRAFFSP